MADIKNKITEFYAALHISRIANDNDVRRIEACARALGVEHIENDAFLALLILMDCFFGVLRELPDDMRWAVDYAAAFMKRFWMAIVGTAVAAGVVMTVAGGIYIYKYARTDGIATGRAEGYREGHADGVKQGRAEVRDEALVLKQRDAFTRTPEFEGAYRLYKLGELESLVKCNKRGWEIVEGVCMPYSYYDANNALQVQGWRVR